MPMPVLFPGGSARCSEQPLQLGRTLRFGLIMNQSKFEPGIDRIDVADRLEIATSGCLLWCCAAEIFKAQIDFMKTIKVFRLSNFVEMMSDIKKQSGVEGWSKVLRTKEQQDQLEQVMVDVKIGEHLLPQELRNPGLVGRREKLRIASDAGVVSCALS